MRVSDKVRKVSRDIIKAYAFHVRKRIKQKDILYIQAGIDLDFNTYERLFSEVASISLGVNRVKETSFPTKLLADCAGAIDFMNIDKAYDRVLDRYADAVYDTCILIFRKVEEGLRKDGYKL